ncbi:hypothetical protein POTOM_013818 [Populus tomentosa]|uniref:Beta-ketoacyl-[acyl-carrier-protein] synthase III C-terminal domain-containing protein n=1 Tax=Populus tomentosa TaxID=118781 RepID=A0A8X8D7A8_POPTO|nr:hypothetical protein POTOM_013818 [Populus tomentosa]
MKQYTCLLLLFSLPYLSFFVKEWQVHPGPVVPFSSKPRREDYAFNRGYWIWVLFHQRNLKESGASTIEGSEKISPSQSGLPRVHLFDSQLEQISDPLSIANAAMVVRLLSSFYEDYGLLSFDLHGDGEGLRYLNASIKDNEVDHALGSNGSVLDFPPKRHAIISCLQMNGKEAFRFDVRCVPQSIECALEKAGHSLATDPPGGDNSSKANQRIIDAVATCLEVPPERIISNVANYGNTSAPSIPLALDEAVRSDQAIPLQLQDLELV